MPQYSLPVLLMSSKYSMMDDDVDDDVLVLVLVLLVGKETKQLVWEAIPTSETN